MQRTEWIYQVNRLLEAQLLDTLTIEEAEGCWAAGYEVRAVVRECLGMTP